MKKLDLDMIKLNTPIIFIVEGEFNEHKFVSFVTNISDEINDGYRDFRVKYYPVGMGDMAMELWPEKNGEVVINDHWASDEAIVGTIEFNRHGHLEVRIKNK